MLLFPKSQSQNKIFHDNFKITNKSDFLVSDTYCKNKYYDYIVFIFKYHRGINEIYR